MVYAQGGGPSSCTMDFRYPWRFESRRSATMATNGMVATSQPLAARTGLDILSSGGTAADAAVATAAVLNVVEPHMTGIGGDMFALTHFDGEYAALNGSGRAPAGATIESYEDRIDSQDSGDLAIPANGGLPVTVPGALDGWARLLDKYGTLELADVLAPAINYARDGFPVSEYIAAQWANAADRLTDYEASVDTWLPTGGPPAPGDQFTNPALAESLELIATEGPDVFYGGELGEAIADTVQSHGGVLDVSDLAAHAGEWTDPIATEYHGVDILEHPPNGQGIVALEALNIAEQFDLANDPADPDRLHHLIEAIKLAFSDGYEYVADPAVVDVPTDQLLSDTYAADRAAEIGHRAQTYPPRARAGDNTIYLSVVDGEGNAVSFINSIYMAFGSGLTARGFALQNRGHSFSLDRTHANALEPGKRPFHTIIPAMLRVDDTFRASWGVMGGSMQPQGHLQVACNLIDIGLNPQAALDAPRFRWLDDRRVAVETSRLPDAVSTNLRGRGHHVVDEDEFFRPAAGHWGGGQIIYRDDEGTLIGGSDPRRDGAAIGY